MDSHRKEIEQLLASLQPSGLSESTLQRLESAMAGDLSVDSSLQALEAQLEHLKPRALKEETLAAMMLTVAAVPFAVNEKVVMFPGTRKDHVAPVAKKTSPARRLLAVAAVATLGGLAALMMPQGAAPTNVVSNGGNSSPVKRPGIVVASYGSDIENVEDRGVVWDQDRRASRVLRFEYQDRALVRDADGVERMLLVPREEVFVVPVKVD